MLFLPVIIACLVENPTQCNAFMGTVETTKSDCISSLTIGLEFIDTNRPDIYAAGLACVEVHLNNKKASKQ